MRTSVPSWWRLIAAFFVALLCCAPISAEQTNQAWPADALVSQILAKAGTPATISLRFENKSQLDAADFKAFRGSVNAEIQRRNLRIATPGTAIADCTITVSQNVNGPLAVVEIKEGLTKSYVIVSLPARTTAARKPVTLTLKDSVAWTEGEQILDFARPNENNIVVLTPNSVIYLFREFYGWREGKRQPLKYDRILPRDPRGKVVANGTAVDIHLPAVHCAAQLADQEAQCTEIDDPWPLDQTGGLRAFFSANKNFFTGALSGMRGTLPPFFSSASTIVNGQPAWVMTGTDGTARLYTELSSSAATFSDWGSDVASLKACDRNELIVSRPGDMQGSDAVQAIEISEGEASPSTTAIEFAGPVMSLTSSPDSVNAVIFNHETRQYEVHVLTIGCQ
jgi:hypothetical protein